MKNAPKQIFLSKYVALSGFASRRKATEYVKEGSILVNGEICVEPGRKIEENVDKVEYQEQYKGNTQELMIENKYVYWMLNKPKDYLCTKDDPYERKTIYELVPSSPTVYSVGRLDQDSQGLLILTNDGKFNQFLTHPSNKVTKTYLVTVKGKVSKDKVEIMMHRDFYNDERLADIVNPPKISINEFTKDYTVLKFILNEGKKREIRRICSTGHLFITKLIRINLGGLSLGGLKDSEYRELNMEEVGKLKK